MANSYNGWSGIYSGTSPLLTVITIPDTEVKLKVRTGDVATIMKYVATRFHKEVEPLTEGKDEWGWAYRSVRGATSLSNHASGTAIDLNAMKHPWQTTATANFSAAQISSINKIVASCAGVIKWLSGHDPMHFEIQRMDRGGSVAAVARLAAKINASEELPPVPVPEVAKRTPLPINWQSPPSPLTKIVQEIVGVAADGIRGTQTMANTRSLQRSLGLPEDGLFGPGLAEAYLLSLPVLRKDSFGPGVKLIQWIGSEDPDGVWGVRTDDAVSGMQAWAGLTVDAIAGPATKKAITR